MEFKLMKQMLAVCFGEYFPNPGFNQPWFDASVATAMLV
jgi:hypothetical protein